MRGMLGFLILFLLSKKTVHGQVLSAKIAVRKGERKPGPGTIYSAPKNLKEMGFIFDQKKEGKGITYKLDQKARNL